MLPLRASLPAREDAPLVLLEPGVLRVHAWKNVNILVWESSATLEAVNALSELVRKRAKEVGTRISAVQFALPATRPPGPQLRKVITERMEGVRSVMGCFTTVIEHEGFASSALRAVLTSLLVFSGSRKTMRIVSSLQEAAETLPESHAQLTGVELDARALLRVLENVRYAHRSSGVHPL